jgi:ADP-heptose:LPS heptosyltransferase
MGDVVLATSVLPVLKSAFPAAKIGFLVRSGTMPVVQGNLDIFRVHLYDHALRKPRGLRSALKCAAATSRLLAELRATRYDWAIELFPRAQNAIPLFYLAGIPTRVGYTSGGWGDLLSHPAVWTQSNRHITEDHKELLRKVGVAEPHLCLCQESLPVSTDPELLRRLAPYCDRTPGMVLCQAGASDKKKEWPCDQWAELARGLAKHGYSVVFTGTGIREEKSIRNILQKAGCGVSLCNQLRWDEFVTAVSLSRLVITVDTAAQHVAAAFNRDCVVIGNGIDPGKWFPRHSNHRYLLNRTPCTPCFRANMCHGRECVVLVKVEQVLEALKDLARKDTEPVREESRGPTPTMRDAHGNLMSAERLVHAGSSAPKPI